MASVGCSIIKETCLFLSLSKPLVGNMNRKMKDAKIPQTTSRHSFLRSSSFPDLN